MVRTTIDLPEPLFRETKALAALRGVSMKQLITEAVERAAVEQARQTDAKQSSVRKFPSFHLRLRRELELSNFDFDDLLA